MRYKIASLAAAAIVFGGVQIAPAADMAVKAPMAAPIAVYNWTGCYIGINGGGAWKTTRFDIANNNAAFFGPAFAAGATPSHYDIDMSGGIVGGT
ncbi:MAG TPA: hypothetical protein VG475_17060, partial [Pseudolabrys sp.]|nr:hypothetical protein [Pseudolabrys sp.]